MMQDEYQNDQEQEIEVEAIAIEVDTQPIELYKVLKIANVVSGGGEAKYAIAEGYVAVNGEIETRKRCKLYDGDLIEFNGEYYVVLCEQSLDETPQVQPEPVSRSNTVVESHSKPQKKNNKRAPSAENKPSNKKKSSNKKSQATIEPSNNGGRSRIHFG